MNRVPVLALCALLAAGCAARQGSRGSTVMAPEASSATRAAASRFAAEIDSLRSELRIPGLAAAVVRDGKLLWAEGFGYADRGWKVPATPRTPFHLASLTKSVAATVLMQLVDKGKVGLDDPLTAWGIRLSDRPDARVRNLLSHTSSGQGFAYDGGRFALIERIIARASGLLFPDRLYQGILEPLGMRETAPNDHASWGTFLVSLGIGNRGYARVYSRLARPYRVSRTFSVVPGWYSLDQSTSAGIMSSVADLAKLDVALDSGALMRAETRERMWSRQTGTSDTDGSLGYGLGWFVQYVYGLRLVWHYGIWPPSCSALWLKVPEQRLSLILLANTDGLSAPFPLGEGDVLTSAFALAFARSFVYPRVTGEELPAVNWRAAEADLSASLAGVPGGAARDFVERELWARRQVYVNAGKRDLANRLFRVRRAAFPDSRRESDRRYAYAYGGSAEEEASRIGLRGIMWGGRAAVVWLLATTISLVLLLRGRLLPGAPSLRARLSALPAVIVFGPLGLASRLGLPPARSASGRRSKARSPVLGELARSSFAASVGGASQYALALFVAAPLAAAGKSSLGLAAAVLPAWAGALALGLFFRRVLPTSPRARPSAPLRFSLIPELLSSCVTAAVAGPVFLALVRFCFPGGASLGSPLFWLSVPAATACALPFLVALQAWAMGRGAEQDDDPLSPLCLLGTAWPALFGGFLLVVGSAVLVFGLLR